MHEHSMPMPPLLFLFVAGLVILLVTFIVRLYDARMTVIKLSRRGLPVAPEHSFFFGHLLYLKKFIDRLPVDAHHHYAVAMIAREVFAHTGAFYLNLWPFGDLFMIIFSPKIATEVARNNESLSCERPPIICQFCKPITGGLTIFDLSEKEWKPWRAVFNKGFQPDHIMSLVPAMVEETIIYAETLSRIATKGEIGFLDPITLRFTIDLIGRTILNCTLGDQKGYNVLADSMLSQVEWHNTGAGVVGDFGHLHPVRRFIQWRNGRRMNSFVGAELDKRYEEYKTDQKPSSFASSSSSSSQRFKSVIDLIIQAYLANQSSQTLPEKLDPTFRATAIR